MKSFLTLLFSPTLHQPASKSHQPHHLHVPEIQPLFPLHAPSAPSPSSPSWITAMILTLPASAPIPPQHVVRMAVPHAPTAGARASHRSSQQMPCTPACPGPYRLCLSLCDSKHHTLSLSKGTHWIMHHVLSPQHARPWSGPCSLVPSILLLSPSPA